MADPPETHPVRLPSDPQVPGAGELLGAEAAPILGAALAAAGARLVEARPRLVRYRPGRSITVSYGALVVEQGSARPVATTLAAHAGRSMPDGVVVVGDGRARIGVWRYPNDPLLPGLRHAVVPGLRAALLAQVGIADPVEWERGRVYRPGRRALVEVRTSRHRLFLKVVRPAQAAALHARHSLLAGAVPVPASHGWSEELGIVVLAARPGRTLKAALAAGDGAVPAPTALTVLLDALPRSAHAAPDLVARAGGYGPLLDAVAPAEAGRIADIVQAVAAAPARSPVPAHGDFHSGQVLLDEGGTVTGLVDVDAFGQGSRADDLATMLAHVRLIEGRAAAAYGATLQAAWDGVADPAGLRLRAAAATLGFAALPFRIQAPDWPGAVARRIRVAEEWVAASR